MTKVPVNAIAVALAAVGVIALAIALVIAGGAYTAPLPGLPDAGPVVVWGAPILRYGTDLAALATIGWLLAAAFLDPSGKDGIVSRLGRRDLGRAAIASIVWAVLAILQMLWVVADVLGVPLAKALDPAILTTYLMDIPTSRALFVMSALAIVVAGSRIASSTTGAAAAWPSPPDSPTSWR